MEMFIKGNKVRVIDNDRYGVTNMDNHTEGIIREYNPVNNNYEIEITRCDDLDFIGDKLNFSYDEIELVDGTKLEFKGENRMNKVLNLYYENHLKEINDKYNELIEKDYSEISVIKEYKELIENFEKQLTNLFTKSVIEEVPFEEVTSYNVYRFEPDECEIKDKIVAKYQEKKSSELKTLMELRDEVEAQLSLSDNVDYQLDVLKRYDIINKKTGRIN